MIILTKDFKMSSMFLFFKSLVLGITLAAPLGPIAILCVRRTLSHGFISGIVTGMYAAVASFGITAVTQALVGASPILRLFGGISLCCIALRIFCATKNRDDEQVIEAPSHLKNYMKTILLTLANPLTIVTFIGIVSALELESTLSGAFICTTGMFCGSMLWHILLVSGINIAKTFLKPSYIAVINYLSGLTLGGLGIGILIR